MVRSGGGSAVAMARQGCTNCKGTGKVTKEKKTVIKVPQPTGPPLEMAGTEKVTETCSVCGGSGWVGQ
jgi:DnaJ-class molecular chaperone